MAAMWTAMTFKNALLLQQKWIHLKQYFHLCCPSVIASFKISKSYSFSYFTFWFQPSNKVWVNKNKVKLTRKCITSTYNIRTTAFGC